MPSLHRSPLNGNQQDKIRYTQSLPSFRLTLTGTDHFSATVKDELKELLKKEFDPTNPSGNVSEDDSDESEMSD
jgi:hypothetical protein